MNEKGRSNIWMSTFLTLNASLNKLTSSVYGFHGASAAHVALPWSVSSSALQNNTTVSTQNTEILRFCAWVKTQNQTAKKY